MSTPAEDEQQQQQQQQEEEQLAANKMRARAAATLHHESPNSNSSSKRARTTTTLTTAPAATGTGDASTVFSFEWPNEPVSRNANGREFHHRIQIASYKAGGAENHLLVRKGDAVFLANDEGSETMVLYVDGFYVDRVSGGDGAAADDSQSNGGGAPVKVQGRWFLGHEDLVAKLGGASITAESQSFLDRLQSNELVLTNLKEEQDIAAIEKKCDIYYFQRTGAPSMPSIAGKRLCRFKLKFDAVNRTVEWGDWDTDDQPGAVPNDAATVDTLSSKDEQQEDEDDDDSSSASSEEANKTLTIQEGEGKIRGDIQVGEDFQMEVGPFVPGQSVRSRKPKLVYKANKMSEEEMTNFLNQVADVHNAYLHQHGISMEEPYSPLPNDRVEEIMMQTPGQKPPTGSFMSTASMLGGTRSRLSKECSADAVLEILADHEYNTKTALITITANLDRITVGWTRTEKEIFDDGFRRHQGALRLIARAIGPTKSLKDVIDYYYRYKIPDQFRKYQNKKREQAVRMVECIETRKYHESLAGGPTVSNNNSEHGGKPSHWSEKSVSNIADSKEERIEAAKKLLLDVKDIFGRDVMAEVGSVIRQLQVSYEPEARDDLFKLLTDQPELQKRFLEFLPKHF